MKDNIKVLRQRLHDLKAEGRTKAAALAKLEAVTDSTDEQTAEIATLEAALDQLQTNVEAANADVEKEEKRLDRVRAFAPLQSNRDQLLGMVPARHITSTEQDPALTAGFGDVAEFAIAVRNAGVNSGAMIDERLTAMLQQHAAPTNFHREGGSDEGHMVPPQFRNDIWELVYGDEEVDLINLVDAEPTSQNAVSLNADASTPWGATGVQANWIGEGNQMTPSRLETDPRMVRLHKLYAFVLATEELLEDAPRLNSRLTRGAARAIRWKASDAMIYGTGAGQPLGYFNSGALVSVGKEGSQTATTLVAQNVAKMFSRLLPTNLSRALWLANSDVVPQLMTMTIGDQPIWTPPATGFQNAPGGFLLGRPVQLTEHAKTLGQKGDVQLIDPFGYYATNKRSGTKFASSIHLYFDYDMQAFRWTFRIGGEPYLESPVSPAHGSNTKSHFVVLDERS